MIIDGRARQVISASRAHSDRINSLAHSPDGHYLASGDDAGEVRIWTCDGAPLCVLHLPGEAASSLAFSPNGLLVTASETGILRFWNWQEPDQNRLQLGSCRTIPNEAFTCPLPDHRLAAIGTPSGLHLFRVSSGDEIFRATRASGPATHIKASPGGRWLAVSDGTGNITMWDVMERSIETSFRASNSRLSVAPLAFNRDGHLLATCELSTDANRTIDIWDWRTGKKTTSLAGRLKRNVAIAFSGNGKNLATCGVNADTEAIIWDAATGRRKAALRGHVQQVNGIAFSPDDEILATASRDRTIKLWSVGTGKPLATLPQGSAWIQSVAFAPDGRTLVSGDRTGSITFWHVPTLTEMFRARGVHTGSVTSIAFAENGTMMMTGAWLTSQGAEVVPWSAPRLTFERP
jgi:WD40 repeat protein